MRKRSNSLAGTINKQTAMIIFAVIASLTLLFASSISKKNNDDRAKLKNSLGAMIVRVIERPMSLNDYISVESAIKIAELPLFLKKLVVIDKEGVEVASFTNGDSPCRLEETTSFNISKRADSGQLILVETKCDLVSENFKLIAFAIAIGFLLISISFLTLKRLINKSLQPLLYIIKQSTSEGQIAKDLISSAPLEIIPLLEKIESAYNLQIDLKRKLEREQVARQVAHDIR